MPQEGWLQRERERDGSRASEICVCSSNPLGECTEGSEDSWTSNGRALVDMSNLSFGKGCWNSGRDKGHVEVHEEEMP